MEQLFLEMQERLEALYRAIEVAVEGLPPEALDWKPAADMNSVAVLLAHTAGALRYWVGDVAGGRSSGRVRADEFETRDVEVSDMLSRLRAAVDFSRDVLAEIDPTSLGEIRIAGQKSEERTVAWSLLHGLEHTAIHTGHIQITRQLWDQQATQ